MSNTVTKAQAGDNHHVQLAKWYHKHNVAREDVLAQLKANKYTLLFEEEVVSFNAISVLGIMLGMEIAEQPVMSLDDIVNQVNAAIKSSDLKWTKTKLVHRPSIAVK